MSSGAQVILSVSLPPHLPHYSYPVCCSSLVSKVTLMRPSKIIEFEFLGTGSKPRSFEATVAEMRSPTPMLARCAPSSTLSRIQTLAQSPNIPASNMGWLLGFGLLVLLVSVRAILCLLSGWRERKGQGTVLICCGYNTDGSISRGEGKGKGGSGNRLEGRSGRGAANCLCAIMVSWCRPLGIHATIQPRRYDPEFLVGGFTKANLVSVGAAISEAVVDPVQLASDVATCGDPYSPPLPSPPLAVITRSMPPTVRMHGNKPAPPLPENAASSGWNRGSQNEECGHERRRALDGGVSLAGGRINRSDTVDSSSTESTLPPEYAEYDT